MYLWQQRNNTRQGVRAPERKRIAAALSPAFVYLRERFTGKCQDSFDCTAMFKMCAALQVFDPTFASRHATPASVDAWMRWLRSPPWGCMMMRGALTPTL
eukprot:scaffold184171_cov35-Tisochrysis_lutea.AAC.1